ncbi:MAG TPA: UDP-N-acetylmuramoyl-L-alanyl-D-glutamate--2,6-diaminopimelate ligase [Actinobacteria bacterium]|nr:UDP-N-acetylmuramoyl-L-alanyl-D-glutamate--2,6-diaminopimelate ligase [Actinomycetota bacterium]
MGDPTRHARPVRLSELRDVLGAGTLEGDGAFVGVVHDSRLVAPGVAFVAIPGFTSDGHAYLPDALAAGAAAAIVERDVAVSVPHLVVPDARRALAVAAELAYGRPSDRLAVVGVTGTNGKTTVTHLLEAIARAAGRRTAVVGTVGARIGDRRVETTRTTPEADDLQRILAEAAVEGVDVVAVEVSSHALALGRVDGIGFAVSAFTNLGQDHLDFHGTMEAYFRAKAGLFEQARTAQAVVFVDDPAGRRLLEELEVPSLSVSVGGRADVVADDLELRPDGTTFRLRIGEVVDLPVRLPLPARFNVANAAVAAGIAHLLGIDGDAVVEGLEAVGTIPGRLEAVPGGRHVVVDYAHTPDAVATVVAAARELTAGRIIVVVGAGGDRDRTKRPAMGAAASAADVVVVTSDNPRSEDPAEIVAEVAAGVAGTDLVVEVDRRTAIHRAVALAGVDDLVLVLGKGHERGQEIDGVVHPFDDRTVAAEAMARLEEAGG